MDQRFETQPYTNTCKKCGKQFPSAHEDFDICYECYEKIHPEVNVKCKKCGKKLTYDAARAGFKYCKKCWWKVKGSN